MNITDKFLAAERAACATLETRLTNLAERAAARNNFNDKSRPSNYSNDSGSSPAPNGVSKGRPSLFLSTPKLYSSVENKENNNLNMREISERKFGGVAFSEISLESRSDDVGQVGGGFRNCSYDSKSEIDGTSKDSIPNFSRTPEGKLEFRPKSPFSLEEEDIERVLGLIESLEARNIFLSQNLSFRDAEYKETRSRLEELEDVLTVANEKDRSLNAIDSSTEDSLLKERLTHMEAKLIELHHKLSEAVKDAEEKARSNMVGRKHYSSDFETTRN